jgi:hypothetical protein
VRGTPSRGYYSEYEGVDRVVVDGGADDYAVTWNSVKNENEI